MKRFSVLILSLLILQSCNLKKPWSPTDPGTTEEDADALRNAPVDTVLPGTIDIGDAEQGVYIEATLKADSIPANVKEDKVESMRDRLAIDKVTITGPPPDKLWATYTVKATREFALRPIVLRSHVMVEGKAVGDIDLVIGKDTYTKPFSVNVDLLSQFQQVPDTFLVTVEGELFLMPEGSDESKINPETAESPIASRAILYNPIRVDIVKPDQAGALPPPAPQTPTGVPPAAPPTGGPEATQPEGAAAEPAPGSTTPSEATPATPAPADAAAAAPETPAQSAPPATPAKSAPSTESSTSNSGSEQPAQENAAPAQTESAPATQAAPSQP